MTRTESLEPAFILVERYGISLLKLCVRVQYSRDVFATEEETMVEEFFFLAFFSSRWFARNAIAACSSKRRTKSLRIKNLRSVATPATAAFGDTRLHLGTPDEPLPVAFRL